MENLTTFSTSMIALLGAVLGVLKYFQYRSRRDKVALVREKFDAVVRSLASTVEVERMSGAILLRRFYDPETEVGMAGTPYWQEAVNVSAAILRGQATGNFQKLLADGLAFAPSLARADLQRTNLQFAYLGARTIATDEAPVVTTLTNADFYRADLSRASLKRANAREAVFYQARLHGTVLSGADLRRANFFEADLSGARFDGALLEGAVFEGARNVPPAVLSRLDEKHVYRDAGPCEVSRPAATAGELRVFISKPSCLDYLQDQHVRALLSRLEMEGIRAVTLERADYPQSGALAEVQRLMSGCSGAVIFGFRQLEVSVGTWRPSTPEQKRVEQQYLSTPWNQIEAGMAAILGLPMLVASQRDVEGGIFDVGIGEHQVYRLSVDEDVHSTSYARTLADWSADVRERSRA